MTIAKSLVSLYVVLAVTALAQDTSAPSAQPEDAFQDLRDRALAKDTEFEALKDAFDAKLPKTPPCSAEIQKDVDKLSALGTERLNAYIIWLNAQIEVHSREVRQNQEFQADYAPEIASKQKEIDLETQSWQNTQRRMQDLDQATGMTPDEKKAAHDDLSTLADYSKDRIEELKKSVDALVGLQSATQKLIDAEQLKKEGIEKGKQMTQDSIERWKLYYKNVLAETVLRCRISRPLNPIEDKIKPIK